MLMSEDGEWEVFFVSPGTPAEKAGFKAGDLIQSVNGIDVEFLDGLIALRKMMRKPAGTKYQVKVRRNGKVKKLSLILKDLL